MRLLRLGICLLIAFSVFAFGAVEVWSVSILEAGAAFLFLWWAILIVRNHEIEMHWSVVYWPLLAFLGLAAVQLAFGVSAYPFLGGVALLKISACALLFFLVGQTFRSRRDLRFLTWFLMCLAFGVAVLGIAQNFTSHYVLYWYRALTQGGDPFGPYVNRNDFAGLMELLAPVGLSLMVFRGVRREQMSFVGILTIVPIVALLLTGSRGGILSFIFEVGVLALIVYVKRSRKSQLIPFAIVLLIALLAIGWLGANRIVDRFTGYGADNLTGNRRVTMLQGTWHVFLDHPLIGCGLGTLVAVYPRYETYYDGKIVNHAHNDYIEALAETGIAGGICVMAFFLLWFREVRLRLASEQSSLSQAIHVAGITACAGLMVHSFVDFNLHIPANGLVFLVMVGMSLSPVLDRKRSALVSQVSYTTSGIDFR
ncbi:MAG TPA: O-antigen ligase family protein [Candidatus Acidoferrales bacterium]|nr:O-antigen ligase family protein [Candidatus Acidoferrales bacterium]